jgi:hypothetical protein
VWHRYTSSFGYERFNQYELHLLKNFPEINTACVACRNLSLQVNGLIWQNALVECMDVDGFEHAINDEHAVKICKCL